MENYLNQFITPYNENDIITELPEFDTDKEADK